MDRNLLVGKCLAIEIIFLFIGMSITPIMTCTKSENIFIENKGFLLSDKSLSYSTLSCPTWKWAKSMGGPDYDWGCDIAIDILGNTYITGTYFGSITFGDITLTTDFGPQIFIAKLSSSGECLWARTTTGMVSIYDQPRIAVDIFMNVYITSGAHDSMNFGDITVEGYQGNVFVAKLNRKGDWQWAVSAGRESKIGWAVGLDIAVDYLGNTYITGPFMGTITFGKTTLVNSCNPGVPGNHYSDVFVVKVNSRGIWQWATSTTKSSKDDSWGISIAVDFERNVYIIGFFDGILFFNNINLISLGGSDVFVAKLNPRGIWQWAKNSGGTENDQGWGIVADRTSNIYIYGAFSGSATFGNTTLTSSFYTVFIAKLDRNGAWQWAKGAGGEGVGFGLGIAMDLNQDLYITGWFQGTITFGETMMDCYGDSDAFVTKLNSDGSWLWATHVGESGYMVGRSIVVGIGGNVFLIGYFQGTAMFGNIRLTSIGEVDIFVAKFR